MGHAAESLERAEHTGHAGHGHGHGGGGAEGGPPDPLPSRIGITMAVLGVILAIAGARVGFERAELVQYLVDQQDAHLKFQAQDIKHRAALLALRQLHAISADTKVNHDDLVVIAKSVNRYLAESQAAKTWVDTIEPVIEAHSEAQEEYEHGQLAAELGIVLASIALLLRRRLPWILAILLGVASLVFIGITYRHTSHKVHDADAIIAEKEKAYLSLREAGKTNEIDQALVDDALGTTTEKAPPKPEPPAPHAH